MRNFIYDLIEFIGIGSFVALVMVIAMAVGY
jgi:hypothetical protein